MVVRGQLAGAGTLDQVLVGVPELGEVQGLRLLDVRHHQQAGAVRLGHVDGDAEVHVRGLDGDRLAVHLVVVDVHGRELGQGPDHGVADQVGEGDLAAAGAGQVGVDDHAVVDQQLGRDGADAGGGGTSRLVIMLVAMALAGPRRTETTSSSGAPWGPWCSWAAGPGSARCRGPASRRASAGAAGLVGGGCCGAGAAAAGAAGCRRSRGRCCRSRGGRGLRREVRGWRGAQRRAPRRRWRTEPSPASKDSNRGHHLASTEFLSCWYRSYSSSTSHSFPPNSSGRRWLGCSGT